MSKPRALILGGGFAGVAAAKALASNSKISTTLIDKSSYQLYYPSLYEAACEEITRQTVTVPLQQIFVRSSVKVVRGEVSTVDKEKKLVHLRSGEDFEYDYLVIALGAESNDFGIKGVAEHAYVFRELKETMLLRDHLRTVFHLSHERGKETVRIAVCGGGFSGVELAAELRHHLTRMIREYHTEAVDIQILEAGPQLLPGMTEGVLKLAEAKLRSLNIEIRLNDAVLEIKRDGVRMKSGEWIPADAIIWTAGTKSNPLPADMGLPIDGKGRPVVNNSLAVLGHPDIYVAGDLAGHTDPRNGRGIAPQASYATQMGKLVGQNIGRSVNKLPLKKFHPGQLQVIIPVGHNDAIFFDKGKVSTGWWPSFLRKLIEFNYLVSLFGPLRSWPIFWAEMQVMTD